MDIAPWMIAAYIMLGLFFYTVMFIAIGPWFTKRMLLKSINSEYGRKVFSEAMSAILPLVLPEIKKAAQVELQKAAGEMLPKVLPAVKAWAAVELRKPETQQYIADMAAGLLVNILDSELEIETDKGKEKIGLMSYFSSAVVRNLEMRFLGDKSVMSRELRDAGALIAEQNVPPQLAAFAGPMMQYAKKHPWLAMLMQYALQSGALEKFKGMQSAGGAGATAYRGV